MFVITHRLDWTIVVYMQLAENTKCSTEPDIATGYVTYLTNIDVGRFANLLVIRYYLQQQINEIC